jgi:hypothetical protein
VNLGPQSFQFKSCALPAGAVPCSHPYMSQRYQPPCACVIIKSTFRNPSHSALRNYQARQNNGPGLRVDQHSGVLIYLFIFPKSNRFVHSNTFGLCIIDSYLW